MSTHENPTSQLTDPSLVLEAMRQAALEAILWHQRLGNPIAVWRNGHVEILPAEQIVVPGTGQ